MNAILVFPDLIRLKGVNLAFKVYIWTKFRLVKALSLFVTWGPAAFALVPDLGILSFFVMEKGDTLKSVSFKRLNSNTFLCLSPQKQSQLVPLPEAPTLSLLLLWITLEL